MAVSITFAGESLMAQKQANHEVLDIARFVLAKVPGLNPAAPIDRAASKPPAGQIVYSAAYSRKGFVNPNQVIYSLMVGSDVGDWDFNWIGLETADGVLFAVSTVPLQQKRKNIPPLQIGNNITRNILLEFNGAQALTAITVDASTWQHDFTMRLNGIDQRERLSNLDVFGRACFLADSLQMERSFGLYQLKAGLAYVQGVRVELAEPALVQLPALPVKAWLDVALARTASDVATQWKVVFGAAKVDYIDSNGIPHYLVPLASVVTSGEITDLRTSEPITGGLVQHFAARTGDYPYLRARATTQADVGLSELPNAKSDDPATNSSEILATTKALQALRLSIEEEQVGMTALFSTTTAPPGWLKENGAAISRVVFARLFAKIGTRFGAGDGVTTFNLRDSRAKFPRFLDDGRGIDVGRVQGSDQGDEIRSHTHAASAANAGGHTNSATATASTDIQGEHSHTSTRGATGGGPAVQNGPASTEGKVTSDAAGAHSHQVTVQVQVAPTPDHNHVITIGSTGGTETRPVNTAYLACIKY